MDNRYVTLKEITTQTTAWESALNQVEDKKQILSKIDFANYQNVFIIGCGSTYYLSLAVSSILRSLTGMNVTPLPSSELLILPEIIYKKGKSLLIAISRSGTTSETLYAVRKFRQNHHGDIIVITNYPDSPLTREADISIAIPEGQEISVAQTRSFSSMLVAVYAIFHLLGSGQSIKQYQDKLVRRGGEILDRYKHFAEQSGKDTNINQVFFLGSGPRYGLACEASLKLKEMSQMVTEPFHFLEFRHGPVSMVDNSTLVVGLVSEGTFSLEMSVMDEVKALGAKTLTLGEGGTDIEFKSGLPETMRDVLYLPLLQLFAYQRAVYLGKNPDLPRNLTAVVKLDL